MSGSTEARMQQLGSVEDEEWMVSGTMCSRKSSRLRSNSGIKSLAGCLRYSQTPLVLQLLSFLFLAGFLLIILIQVLQLGPSLGLERCRPCPWDWTFLLGNCYFFSKSQRNWNNAVKACQEVEAQLVIIESDEEQTFLQQTSKAKGPTWMGLSDLKKEATWLWVDGSPLASRFQKYWNRGEPNNVGKEDCVEFAGDGWNDSKCELQKFWICKKSATPCTAS
ncbi:CD209 antigen-like protein B [Onychomys torridus]|uniref:CD209 antigen-like protein B n=1 Tax=Onychomys torridus TaxID=38674 RepID=UPI00167FA48D|nr:CD209 antigen-like protein B [Onychomys torridus]